MKKPVREKLQMCGTEERRCNNGLSKVFISFFCGLFLLLVGLLALYIAKGKEMIAENRKILYLMCMFSALMIIFSFLKNGVTQCI